MPNPITVAIEGPDANRALEEILASTGVRGQAQPPNNREFLRDGGVLVVIGTIVGIVGGTVAIVESIIEWRAKWKAKAKHLNVIIEDGKGNRLALEDATPEEITAVLQTLGS